MSIVFLFDENPDVASDRLGGVVTDWNGLPEGPSIPHRRCPRGQLGGGGGSGSCSSLRPPCKMFYALRHTTVPINFSICGSCFVEFSPPS